MTLGRNGYIQPVEIVAAGVGPARNGWVQPVEIVGGGGGGGAVGDIVDADGSTTDSYVAVDGFPVTRADGLIGIGSILNTGAETMNVRETVTDKFGNTESVVTPVAAGDSYLLDLQTNFAGLAFPPYVEYTVEVQSASAGDPTDYDLHFIDITPSTGGGGGSETLDEARQNGDFFLGDVYWQGSSAALFGVTNSESDKDYLQIYSNKVGNIQVINSAHVGVGATTRPISVQMDGVEIFRWATDGSFRSANLADPTKTVSFVTNGNGDMSVSASSGDQFAFQQSLVGSNLSLEVNNLDTGNTASGAKIRMSVGGTGGGDPFLTWVVVGGTTRSFGLDNDDSDILKLTDGASPSAGTTLMSVDAAGNVFILGKLTVTGAIDPTSLSLSGSAEGANVLYLDSANGISAAVAPANHGRLRYNNTSKTWQQSVDGGAYSDIGGGGGSGPWTLAANVITPTDTTDQVRVGTYTGTAASDWDFPNQHMVLRGETDVSGGTIYYCQHANNEPTSPAEFTGYRSRGTMATPLSLDDGDVIVRFGGVGFSEDTGMHWCAAIDIEANRDWGATYGGDVVIKTTITGGVPTERFRVHNTPLVPNGSGAYRSYLADDTEVDLVSCGADDIVYVGGGTIADALELHSNTIQMGINGSADVLSKGNLRLPNNKSLNSKTTGGTTKWMIGIASDDIMYVGDSDPVHVFSNTISLGINTSSVIKTLAPISAFGVTGASTSTALMMAQDKSIGSKTSGNTYVDLLYFSGNVLYLGDQNTPIHLFNNNIIIGQGSSSDIKINGDRLSFFSGIVAAQPAAIPDAAGGVVVDAEARSALNALLAAVRSVSLIAT